MMIELTCTTVFYITWAFGILVSAYTIGRLYEYDEKSYFFSPHDTLMLAALVIVLLVFPFINLFGPLIVWRKMRHWPDPTEYYHNPVKRLEHDQQRRKQR